MPGKSPVMNGERTMNTNYAMTLSVSFYVNDHGKQACCECHRYDCLDKVVVHAKKCSLRNVQPTFGAETAAVVEDRAVRSFARHVVKTGTNGGDDSQTLRAHRAGYLSTSQSMNLDD